jgi:hypothetical protein
VIFLGKMALHRWCFAMKHFQLPSRALLVWDSSAVIDRTYISIRSELLAFKHYPASQQSQKQKLLKPRALEWPVMICSYRPIPSSPSVGQGPDNCWISTRNLNHWSLDVSRDLIIVQYSRHAVQKDFVRFVPSNRKPVEILT